MKMTRLFLALLLLFSLSPVHAAPQSGPIEWTQIRPATGWNPVIATGVLATDTANLTAAFAGSATYPVFMNGAFNVCSQLTVPNFGVIYAKQGNDWQYYNAGGPAWAGLPTTRIGCNGSSSFSSGQAFIKAGDQSWIEGIAILGLSYPTPGTAHTANVNCIDVSNSFYVSLIDVTALRCNEGILANSQGSSDPNHNHIEGLDVKGGLYAGNDDHGIYNSNTNGGFISDSYFGNKVNFASNGSAGLYFNYVAGTQFDGIRVEDTYNLAAIGGLTPPYGIDIEGSAGVITIVGGIFDRNGAASMHIAGIDGGQGSISIVGNTSEFPFWKAGNTGTSYHIEFAGTIYGVQMSGNNYGLANGQTGDNTYSNYVYKCTACNFTGNSNFAENAQVQLNGVYYDDLTASKMAVFTPSLPAQNYIPGGAGLTSAWSGFQATLTPAAIANPYGTTPLAASVIEDSSTNQHYIEQDSAPFALANATYTLSCYIKNASGSRNIGLTVANNGGFANYSQVVFNPTAGGVVQTTQVGTATISGTSSASIGNGWYLVAVTYATGGTSFSTPTYQFGLYSGVSNNYAGNGTSGVYVWGCQNNAGLPVGMPSPILARATSAPSNPTGTANTSGLMMGLAGTITPNASGNVAITINGTIFNPTAIADGAKVQIRYGTGAAPANAGALAGTTCGSLIQYVAATTAEKAPFSESCYATGLTPGTAYWIDVGLAAITGGTATLSDVNIVAAEQ